MSRWTAGLAAALVFAATLARGQEFGWTVIARPDPLYALNTVCFVDSIHGWCAGHLRIYRTTDGGATWEAGSQPYLAASFFDLSFSDTLRGWAVGSLDNASAMIWRTTDGGISWSDQTGYRDKRKYLANIALSVQKCIAVGRTYNFFPDTGMIIQTTDGGLTWSEKTLADSLQRLERIASVDSNHCWLTSGSLTGVRGFGKTTDGGASWHVLQPPEYFQALFFIDALRGWAAAGSRIYRTSNGGETWQYLGFIHDPDPLSRDNLSTSGLAFSDPLNGRAFGRIVYQGIITAGIYRTTDGGSSWFRESIGLTGDFGGINDAVMLDAYHGWAVCNDGSVLRYHMVTGIGKPPDRPRTFSLLQNYPNPFNPTTTIEYEIADRCHVSLLIYDALGRMIQSLVGEKQGPGLYGVLFDGSKLPSGAYYCRLTAGGFTQTNEMILVK